MRYVKDQVIVLTYEPPAIFKAQSVPSKTTGTQVPASYFANEIFDSNLTNIQIAGVHAVVRSVT